MNKIKFNDGYLVELLEKEIPAFGKYIVSDFRFSAYMIYGDFGIYLRDGILNNSLEITTVEKGFNILNDLILNGDTDIVQMIRVTTLEVLSDDALVIETSKKYLKDAALELFLQVINLLK